MAHYDTILTNGVIVDGTGSARYLADIGITNGRIEKIGDLAGATGSKTIDVEGRFIGPGFVDVHTHFDAQIFHDPTCSDALQNGITSVAMSNCGIGLTPCRPEDRERYMRQLEFVEQIPLSVQQAILPWDWETIPEYIQSLRRTKKAINVSMYAPLAPIQMYAMGIDDSKKRAPTSAEIDKMKSIISEAMDAGAIGLSICYQGENSGHVDSDGGPLPNDVLSHDDLLKIAAVMGERGDGIIQCLSGRAGIDPTYIISEKLAQFGRPVLHSFLSQSDEAGMALNRGLEWHDRVNSEGKTLFAQAFSGRGWSETNLSTAVNFDMDPTWRSVSTAGSDEKRISMLKDPAFRQRLKDAYVPETFSTQNGLIEGMTLLSAEGSKKYEAQVGKTMEVISKDLNMHVVDLYADINIETGGRASWKTTDLSAKIDHVKRAFGHHNVIIGGSDGGAHLKSFVGAGWTTDLMTWMVRDTKSITVELAHYQMSYIPARTIGLRNRGALIEGMAADMVIYHLEELYYDTSKYKVSHDLPAGEWRKRINSGGYRWIMVNGVIASESDKYTSSASGEFLAPAPVRMRAGNFSH